MFRYKQGNFTKLPLLIFLKKANLDNKIKIILGPAIETFRKLKNDKKVFDMIFIDADKENYKNYYNLSLELVKKNGFILVDNVLWKGRCY